MAWTVCAGLTACSDPVPHEREPEPEPEFPPPASAFLDPERYDCRAGEVTAPERPHAADCFADASCVAPLVAGHRMATPFAPENSLSALRAAILLGVDIVETDVRLTADGVVVLIHDGTIDRTLEGRGEVASFSLDELAAIPMRPTAAEGEFGCERVPTLEQALAIAGGQIIVELEVKESDAGVVTAEYLRDHDLYGHAFLLCDSSECDAARAAVPDVPIMTRPKAADEVAAAIAYDPPPIMVHIDAYDSFLTEAVLGDIASVGAKAYANAFLNADIEALADGRFEAYPELYARGLDVVQTELPQYALVGLDRLALP